MSKQLVILVGGAGTRLKSILGDLPKPMIQIGGKPLLEHHVELAKRYGFEEVLFCAHYRADIIENYFGDGSKWGIKIKTIVEKTPMGTAGAVLVNFDFLADEFVLMNGDALTNVDLGRLCRAHADARADATFLVHPNNHPQDSELVVADEKNYIKAFHARPHPQDRWFPNSVNAGLYVIRKAALAPWAHNETPMDLCKELFPAVLGRGGRLFSHPSQEYIRDIGTPERYQKACAEYEKGVVQKGDFSHPRRAVFLDRDGTLIKEVNGLTSPDQLEILPGTAQALETINCNGYLAVLVTNQPVVAKGFCTEADIQNIHNKMETLLGREHAYLDKIYYCPHHPEKGFKGERAGLKIDCACRKPKPGMLLQAAKDLNLDLAKCWMIGDTTTDIKTAQNIGIKSILLQTGYAGGDKKYDAEPDFVAPDLQSAVQLILRSNAATIDDRTVVIGSVKVIPTGSPAATPKN